jgi:hypothetical protein
MKKLCAIGIVVAVACWALAADTVTNNPAQADGTLVAESTSSDIQAAKPKPEPDKKDPDKGFDNPIIAKPKPEGEGDKPKPGDEPAKPKGPQPKPTAPDKPKEPAPK